MKVAYVIGALPFGGVETLTLDTMTNFSKRADVRAVMVNISGCGVKQADYEQAGLEVVSMDNDLSCLKTHKLSTVLRLRKFLRAWQPDIIHAMLFPGNYFSRLAALGLNIPVVNHIHNTVSDSNEGPRHRFINHRLSRFTSLYISVSHMVRDYTEKELNVAHKPSVVIYNAFNPQNLDAPAHDLKAMYGFNGPVIVQIGHMVKIKNFDKTIDAFRRVLQARPDARLLFLGEGPERARLEEVVDAYGLRGKVVLAGYRTDVFSFLKSCHLLVMPSDHEGFGIAHLEAMACGLPAVISHHVPSKELTADCALLCDTTPESIAENITRLLTDQPLYQSMSRAALQVAGSLTMDNHCNSLMQVYTLLANRRPIDKIQY